MLIFNSEMHVVTFIFIILEFGMFVYQLIHYLSFPEDASRFWYLILLGLLIFYNITGGLFPDAGIGIPIVIQNIMAYGSGFLMASYFPYFFYRGFYLTRLRFHAIYGVPLFLILPFLVFFVVYYSLTNDLDMALKYGLIVPFVYSFVILWAILNAIRIRFREHEDDGFAVSKFEATWVYCAVAPWVCLTGFAYFHVTQWIEVLATNLGFVLITVIFMVRAVRRSRMQAELLKKLEVRTISEEIFEANLVRFEFSAREVEVIRLIRQGYSKQEIGEKLFIATTTVSRHVQNIHYKADVSSRLELMRKLELEEIPEK